jgi:hypothetical protein
LPPSYRFPPRAGGTQQRFPLRSRGNLTEGVFKKCRAMSVHGGGLGWGQWGAKKEDAPRKGRAHLAHFGSGQRPKASDAARSQRGLTPCGVGADLVSPPDPHPTPPSTQAQAQSMRPSEVDSASTRVQKLWCTQMVTGRGAAASSAWRAEKWADVQTEHCRRIAGSAIVAADGDVVNPAGKPLALCHRQTSV